MESLQTKMQKQKKNENIEQTIQEQWGNFKRYNITGILKGEERENRRNIWNHNGWELSKIKDSKPRIKEFYGTPSRINTKELTPGHTIFKLQTYKDKEKIFKGTGERLGGREY